MNRTGRIQSIRLAAELRPTILRLSRNIRRQANSQGTSSVDVQILISINDNPGITSGELATKEQMSRPSMTGHIKRLVQQGHVRKAAPGIGSDGRYVALRITRAGKTFLTAFARNRRDWLAERITELSMQERSDLDHALKSIRVILEEDVA